MSLISTIAGLFSKGSSNSKIKGIDNPKTADFGEIKSLEDVCRIFDQQPDLKIASFDFMDTLVQWTSSVSERHGQMYSAAESIFKEHGYDISADEYKLVRDKIWYQLRKDHHRAGTDFRAFDALTSIVFEALKAKGQEINDTKKERIAQEIEDSVYQIERKTIELVPGARETLQYLKDKGKKIILYSNTPFHQGYIKNILASLGILDFFDRVVVSSEFGMQKTPHNPSGYKVLAYQIKQAYDNFREIGVRNSTLHVGDNSHDDYRGALNAGLRAAHFQPPSAFAQKLNRLEVNSKDYSCQSVECLNEALEQKVERIINQSLSPEVNSDDVKEFLKKAYHLSKDKAGPVFAYFSDRILKSAVNQPKKLLACLGRDGLGPFEIMKNLLRVSPQSYPGVREEQIKYLNISRQVICKALLDGGIHYPIGYEGKVILLPIAGRDGHSGYKRLLREYLEQFCFDKADAVRFVDSGIVGSTQSAIQTLFPEWRNKIKGKYLYCFRKNDDPFKNDKEGYLLMYRAIDPENKFSEVVKGKDFFYVNQSIIYFFEDFFNGFESSNSHLDERIDRYGNRIIEPRTHFLDYNVLTDPGNVNEKLKHTQIYRLAKNLVIEGLKDSAQLFARVREVDPSSKYHLYPGEGEAEAKLRTYLEGYLGCVEKNKSHPNSDIFNMCIRKLDYRKQEEKFKELWAQQNKP